jgi:hypothetical protein
MTASLAIKSERVRRSTSRQTFHKFADDVSQRRLCPPISLVLDFREKLGRETLEDAVDGRCVSGEFD